MLTVRIKDYLKEALGLPVWLEEPERPPESYLLVFQTGSGKADHIDSAVIAVQSFSGSLIETMKLNERVLDAMERLPEHPEISRCRLNSDYDFTDTRKKRYRWQAVFDITYYRGG